METFVAKLRQDYPALQFTLGPTASWSHQKQTVSYADTNNEGDIWSVLHELGHALLGHKSFLSDVDLLRKEIEAWDKAAQLGEKYQVTISLEHVQSCLDTYRDWLHKRSSCPDCGSHGLQQNEAIYSCLNCQAQWKVGSDRFCRPYRLKSGLEA